MSAQYEDPLAVIVKDLSEPGGFLLKDQNLIVLDINLGAAERTFGEGHLRAHAAADISHGEADRIAVNHLVSLSQLRAALRASGTAADAADELGVTVHALWVRVLNVRESDRYLADELAAEVEWPPTEDMPRFGCAVVSLDKERARRSKGLGIAA
ncbi:hypothetical protein ACIGKR_12375 [Rhodococcus qingshengii]|uniref:hypothetical protein n=1 Tax=Rhodococcus qingshengii TaxID=334542 RepID=UPI0037C9B2D1